MSVARQVRDTARAEKMATMYLQGVPLQKIGGQFKVSRERVRQILRTVGIDASEGGQALKSRIRRATEAPKISVYAVRLGLSQEAYEVAMDSGLLQAFRNQCRSAEARDIKWRLTYPQWLAVWQASCKLDQRGRGADAYCMSRINDAGGYELGSDKGQLSRWESGGEGVVWPKLSKLMDTCGNDAPLLWMAHARGYDLHAMRKRETELQAELRRAREENAALRRVLMGSGAR